MRLGRAALVAGVVLLLIASRPASAQAIGCSEHFDSTFALIQKVVFERHGCTSTNCHVGPAPAGGLDLSPEVAYDNLVDHPVESISTAQFPGLSRVVPGSKGRSLLWLNLASATLPSSWKAPLRSMPLGGLPPLTFDELEVVQLWIEQGATRDGVVPGTAELVNACLPPEKPLKAPPLPPPPPGLGVQIRAPHQVLDPSSERETCFVNYYDLTDQVPEEFRDPGGNTFRFKRIDARQDPLSHHAVAIVYRGSTPIDSPVWGKFTCNGGPHAGTPCAPGNLTACGEGGMCASPPVQAVACIGYGPGDASIGIGEDTLFNTMGAPLSGGEGIYDEAPLKGILVWNSHAFNLTDEPASLDMWINFDFAAPDEQQHRLEHFVDITAIAKMHVPAFGVAEVCHHHVLPPGARVLELSSHVHQRGKRFRIFEGAFSCQGGPHNGDACSPLHSDRSLPLSDLCAGAPCQSAQAPTIGDCDHNLTVSVDELVMGVSIALGSMSPDMCPPFDGNGDGAVMIDEVVAGVDAALRHGLRDPEASLIYTSLTYADPLILTLDPPKLYGAVGSSASERTLTYCALYDNGFSNPDTVKRNSRVPDNGIPCNPTNCTTGIAEAPCTTDADCDSTPGAGDGFCDACQVHFGVSTEDEMFVLLGSYISD